MGVSQNQRSPGGDVIEVLIAVEIVEIWPLAASDEQRLPADSTEGAGWTVDTSRNETAGALKGLSTTNTRRQHEDSSSV